MKVPERWQTGLTGASLTSMKVGGEIRFFSKPATETELAEDIRVAVAAGLPIKVLGGGSNLLFADKGFAGLVVQPQCNQIIELDGPAAARYQNELDTLLVATPVAPRYTPGGEVGSLRLEQGEERLGDERTLIEIGSSVPWGKAVVSTLRANAIGLHWFARIPCHVGGAIYNNIHGERHFLSEIIAAVRAVNMRTGESRVFGPQELAFGYDYSRFHRGEEVITAGIFALEPVPEPLAKDKLQQYTDWTVAKAKVQPSGANCGSVFQNIAPHVAAQAGTESLSAAWYIDQCGLRGTREGGMQVYPGHANFIVNDGTGTQADFIALVQRIRTTVQEKFGLALMPEAEAISVTGEPVAW